MLARFSQPPPREPGIPRYHRTNAQSAFLIGVLIAVVGVGQNFSHLVFTLFITGHCSDLLD